MINLVEWYNNNEQDILDNISLKVKYNNLSSQFGAPAITSVDLAFQQPSDFAALAVQHQWT